MKIIDVNGIPKQVETVKPDSKFPGFLKVTSTSKRFPDKKLTQWYPIDKFIKKNPKLAHLAADSPDLPQEVVGTVTSAKKNTVTDDTQYWETDSFSNFPIWISRGRGEGQTRTIIGNTKDTLTLDKNWKTTPDQTSQYVISSNIHHPKAMGNTLPDNDQIQLATNEKDATT